MIPDFAIFLLEDKLAFAQAVGALINNYSLEISVRKGSVIIRIDGLTTEEAERLIHAAKFGRLDHFNAVGAHTVDSVVTQIEEMGRKPSQKADEQQLAMS